MKKLAIDSQHLDIVSSILQKHLPQEATVWVFGSRARGTPKPYSDLDLAVDIGEPLSLDLIAKLTNDFDESILPYKVDIVDWCTISDSFREHIQKERVLFSIYN